jgi:hypothetical protein
MSLSGPTLWGQLPFDLLSKILKVEKDRLDEIAMNEWKLSIKDLNHEFKDACNECNWRGGEEGWIANDQGNGRTWGDPRGLGYPSDETNYPEHKCVFRGADPEETLYYVLFFNTLTTTRTCWRDLRPCCRARLLSSSESAERIFLNRFPELRDSFDPNWDGIVR